MAAATLTDLAVRLPSLEGRVAVVSNAGGPVGRACAEILARLGAAIGVLDSDGARGAALAAAIEAAGGNATALIADLADQVEVEAAAAELARRFGECDVLVNCVEGAPQAPLEELALTDWDRSVEFNLGGAFACMQAFGAGMLAGGAGSVVNVCPTPKPRAEAAAATTAGAGLKMLARLGAVEWGNRGVRVNSLEIGPGARPGAVAAAAAFLAGEWSSYVTGESFEVNQED